MEAANRLASSSNSSAAPPQTPPVMMAGPSGVSRMSPSTRALITLGVLIDAVVRAGTGGLLRAKLPSILVEAFFLSHSDEVKAPVASRARSALPSRSRRW